MESIIKFFLTSKSLKAVINGQFSVALAVNAGGPERSLFGPTHFLILINDLLKNILRSFVKIYAVVNVYDTMIYRGT